MSPRTARTIEQPLYHAGGTGNAVRVTGYEEWTISEEGLIATSRGHYDAAEYARQLAHGV